MGPVSRLYYPRSLVSTSEFPARIKIGVQPDNLDLDTLSCSEKVY